MTQYAMIGTTELLFISGVALLLFGGKKLPEMMRGLGQGVKEFKQGMKDVKDEVSPEQTETQEDAAPAQKDEQQQPE